MPNLLQRLFSPPAPAATKATGPYTEAMILNLELTNPRDRAYPQLVDESYNTNSIAHRAIAIISESASSVPLLLYKRGQQKDELVPTHPILDVLAHPNQVDGSGRQFRALLTADLKVSGEAFILWLASSRNTNAELHLLRPDLVRVQTSQQLGGKPTYEYRDGSGRTHTYGPDEILHIKTLDLLRTGRGYSSVKAIASDLDQSNLSGRWNVSLLKNAGRPSLLILTKSALDEKQLTQMRAQKEALMAGTANAGRIAAFAGEDIQVKDLGLTPKDMDWIEGQKAVESRIASGLGVPPELLNLGQATFNNRLEAKRSFYQETIIPLVSLALEALNAWLIPKLGKGESLYLAAYWEKVDALQTDKKSEYERIDNAFASGWLTINEARGEVGFDPDPAVGGLYKWQADAYARLGVLPSNAGGKSQVKTLLVTEEQKTAYWKAVDGRKRAYEAALAKKLRQHLDQERLRVKTANVLKPEDLNTAVLQAQDPKGMEDLLKAAYLAVMEDFGSSVLDGLNAKGARKSLEDVFTTVYPETLDFIQKNAATAVQQVTDTIRKGVRNAVQNSVAAGDNLYKVRTKIDQLYLEQIIPNRSEVIARTEIVKAANAGSHLAAKGTGLPLTKQWLSSRDSRVRPDHEDADGQRQPMDVPYDVGGATLQFPGDPAGPPGEVIQCRCVEVYLSPGETQ